MINRLKTTDCFTHFVLTTSDINYCLEYNTPNSSHFNSVRMSSSVSSVSYQRSLRRAFSNAKMLAFFNPDLTNFITLTYANLQTDIIQCQQHIKDLIKNYYPGLKYIYVFELQDRGAIHVHMITDNKINTTKIKFHNSLIGWKHGFSDVRTISDFDSNFKPYIYLFKYMNKTQRVGKSFIHRSRNFDEIKVVDYAKYVNALQEGNIYYKEDYKFDIDGRSCSISKKYYKT
jgi:hypothetical protein